MSKIQLNLIDINSKIKAACKKSGRNFEDVKLIGVTKTIDVSRMEKLSNAGVKEFGENKVQEILNKYDYFENINWHMIGHLQSNKVKFIVDKVNFIHSVDSLSLAQEISKRCKIISKNMNILLEVNIAGEENKFGVSPDKTLELAREISKLENVSVNGLMCVAPYVENSERNREYFQKMRHIAIDIKSCLGDNINMQHLSMGMTNDYEIAIEEGATMIRIGTGIFGERHYDL